MPTKAQQLDIDAAQNAMRANLRTLRTDLKDLTPAEYLRQLLVSVFEWADHHAVDFDAEVSAVRAELSRAEAKKRA